MTSSPATAGGVETDAVPVLNAGRYAHFTLPLSMSMANRPPRPVWLPARIVVPATAAGLQSLKPGFTVSVSTGWLRIGWIRVESDCASPGNAHSTALMIVLPAKHFRLDAIIGGLLPDSLSNVRISSSQSSYYLMPSALPD